MMCKNIISRDNELSGCIVSQPGFIEDRSNRFEPPVPIEKLAEYASPIVSCGNQTGEGWFLTGEMMELIHSGVTNIVCAQPFGCLPNHVVGKGVI